MNSKKSKGKKPKISEEDKREKIRDALMKKKSFEEKALQLVEQMLEKKITSEALLESALILNQGFYQDAVEERSLTGVCGYPICDNQKPSFHNKGKFHISLKDKKVYDLADRKFFCSNFCFKASNFFKEQLETSPLWMQENVKNYQNITLYHKDKNESNNNLREMRGEEVDIGLIESMGKNDDNQRHQQHKLDIENEDDLEDDIGSRGFQDFPLEEPEENSDLEKRAAIKVVPKKPNKPVLSSESPFDVVKRTLVNWFTVDSFRVLFGEEQLKTRLRECNVSDSDGVWAAAVGDTSLEEQYQARYRELCRRLDLAEILEDRDSVTEADRLPLPSFELLKKHSEEENLKMGAFLAGQQSFDRELVTSVVEKEVDTAEPRIPLLDHRAQQQLRRKLVLEYLMKTAPDILKLIKLTLDDIRTDLKKLVNTFKLSADNVTFKPEEWTLLVIVILKLLSELNSDVNKALLEDDHKKCFTLVLMSYQIDMTQIDLLIRDLTADIKLLVANYQL